MGLEVAVRESSGEEVEYLRPGSFIGPVAVFNVNYFCRLASIILAGSPPYPDASAWPLRCGSWGHRIPG